jgi:hypothetical protein
LVYFREVVTFLRNSALLLPAGFLAAAFVFLVTHGPQDPALTVYPFMSDWIGADRLPRSPEVAFLVESAVLFALPYLAWLILVFLVVLAERAVFGPRSGAAAGAFRITFSRFAVFFLLIFSGAIGASTGVLKRRLKSEASVGAAAVAAAPFAAGLVAPIPAFLVALPVAGFLRMRQ